MIRTQLAGLLSAPRIGQLGVLGGVLHVLVADPVLHKLEFAAGVKEVGGDGVLEMVQLALLRRQARLCNVRRSMGSPRLEMNRYGDESVRARR